MSEISKITQLLKLLRAKVESETPRIVTTAAFSVLAELQDRIFRDGKAADDSQIGSYSSDEIWIKIPYQGVNNSRFKKKGKPKGKDKKAKETKETMYFVGGYSEFRKKAGRQNDKVDLSLSGELARNVIVGKKGDSIVIGISTSENVKKAESLEKMYKKTIFKLTNEEKSLFLRIINRELETLFKNIFS